MELKGAIATDVGNVRESNQDRAHFGGYLAVVADGMGGHQGGEMAASIAISTFVDVNEPVAPGGLVDLVEGANRAVFEKAADPELRGMGTTLVAMTLRPTEEKISVVNVGDSRAYFLRGDQFAQLTNDHSLVEDLVRQNRLTPEEALTHPQRNILTRALGISSEVEVDRFLVPAKLGDRFLLCSDGLFNEVSETDIVQILTENPEPNDAADALVEAALAAAGRDNITVAVVDVVGPGEGGDVSSEAAETLLVPSVDAGSTGGGGGERFDGGGGPGVAFDRQGAVGVEVAAPQTDQDGVEVDAVRNGDLAVDVGLDAAPADAEAEAEPIEVAPTDEPRDTGEIEPVSVAGRRGRRSLLVGLVAVAVLAAVVYVGVNRWADSQWYVDVTGDEQVAVFRGRPEGFLWTTPSQEQVEGPLAELTPDARNQVREQRTFESQADAEAFIDGLERDVTAAAAELDDVADEIAPATDGTADSTVDNDDGTVDNGTKDPDAAESTTTTAGP